MADKKRYYEWHIGYYYGILDEVQPFLGSTLVLDVGCGTGWFGAVLKRYNPRVTVIGVDNDLAGLREANSLCPVLACGTKLPFKNCTFDGLVAKALLEHLLVPLEAVTEFNRILKPGAKIFVSVPDVRCKHFWDDYTHVRPFSRKSLVSLLEDGGFAVQKVYYVSSLRGLGIFVILANFFRRYTKTPRIVRILGKLGIGSNTINCIATKEQ